MDLSILNEQQRKAVECLEGPLLVLAGAGSGKTRVLTYRIANLVEHGVKPWNILALTFTNKAAAEMRQRAAALVGEGGEEVWVTTFHSCCYKLLRMDCDRIGYDRNFTIYDDSDQMKVISDILKAMGMSDKNMPKREMKERISNAKNKSLDAGRYIAENYDDGEGLTLRVFQQYQKRLMAANAFDFDDLLVKTLEMLEQCPELLEKYRNRFRYVLVDEYQDTNMPQYRFVELLCREHGNLCVVGDDDQSIYGWRGADIRNIMSFEKDFKNAAVIRLEQNYRSTRYILDAANAVIDHNEGRKRKTLWTAKEGGDAIGRYEAQNERDEAAFICRTVLQGVRDGGSYGDYAVLYRMNAQSRVLESMLVNYGIPHKVYGGFRFYERREIVDILAYLRLMANPHDDVAFSRVVNVPRRGLGDKTMEEIRAAAELAEQSMLLTVLSEEGLSPKTVQKLKPFSDLITELMAQSATMPLADFTEHLISAVRYEEYLLTDDKKGDAETRMENLRELVGNIKEIERDVPEGENPLNVFLENVALVSDIDAMEENNGSVALMTLHSAKGLEFPVVFLAGMEENVFPTRRAKNELTRSAMEEERRLCYVGVTRARQKLYLINAQSRALFGDSSYNRPSRFIEEIPWELFEHAQTKREAVQQAQTQAQAQAKPIAPARGRRKPEPSRYASGAGFGVRQQTPPVPQPRSASAPEGKAAEFSPYMKVRHEKFGGGVVTEVSGAGASMTVAVEFDSGETKRFAAAYAPIIPMEE